MYCGDLILDNVKKGTLFETLPDGTNRIIGNFDYIEEIDHQFNGNENANVIKVFKSQKEYTFSCDDITVDFNILIRFVKSNNWLKLHGYAMLKRNPMRKRRTRSKKKDKTSIKNTAML